MSKACTNSLDDPVNTLLCFYRSKGSIGTKSHSKKGRTIKTEELPIKLRLKFNENNLIVL
jgi:hypothetical protein